MEEHLNRDAVVQQFFKLLLAIIQKLRHISLNRLQHREVFMQVHVRIYYHIYWDGVNRKIQNLFSWVRIARGSE